MRKIFFVIALLFFVVNLQAQKKIFTNKIDVKKELKLNGSKITSVTDSVDMVAPSSNVLVSEQGVVNFIAESKDVIKVADTPNSSGDIPFQIDTSQIPNVLYFYDGTGFRELAKIINGTLYVPNTIELGADNIAGNTLFSDNGNLTNNSAKDAGARVEHVYIRSGGDLNNRTAVIANNGGNGILKVEKYKLFDGISDKDAGHFQISATSVGGDSSAVQFGWYDNQRTIQNFTKTGRVFNIDTYTKDISLDFYGKGEKETGAETYLLGVDIEGDVVEVPLSGGTGGGDGVIVKEQRRYNIDSLQNKNIAIGRASSVVRFDRNSFYGLPIRPQTFSTYTFDLSGARNTISYIYHQSSAPPIFPDFVTISGGYLNDELNLIKVTYNGGIISLEITQAVINKNGLVEVLCDLIEGQSNAAGNGILVEVSDSLKYVLNTKPTLVTTQSTIDRDTIEYIEAGYNTSGNTNNKKFGIEVGLAYEQKEPKIYLKYAIGGRPLDKIDGEIDWHPQSVGEVFDDFRQFMYDVDAAYESAGIRLVYDRHFYLQGEADSQRDSSSAEFGANLALFVDSTDTVLGRLNNRSRKCVFVQLQADSLTELSAGAGYQYAYRINAAMDSLASLYGDMAQSFPTQSYGYTYKDLVHYDGNGLIRMGIDLYSFTVDTSQAPIFSGVGSTALPLYVAPSGGIGDNFGNHIATQTIVLGTNSINGDNTANEGLKVDASGRASITTPIQSAGLEVVSTSGGANGASVKYYHNSTTPAAGDAVNFSFDFNDAALTRRSFGFVKCVLLNPTSSTVGFNPSRIEFLTRGNGSSNAARFQFDSYKVESLMPFYAKDSLYAESNVKFNAYGNGTITGFPASILASDSDGDIIETDWYRIMETVAENRTYLDNASALSGLGQVGKVYYNFTTKTFSMTE